MTPATIRIATVDDAALVASVGARLFVEAYGPTHPEPELSRYLDRSFSIPAVTARLVDPAHAFLIVEDTAGAVKGYAHLHRSTPPLPAGITSSQAHEISRFYVEASCHGRGIAQQLMGACEAFARRAGSDRLWLQVWQEAPRAIAFYRNAGFTTVGDARFLFGDRVDRDWLITKPL